VGIAAEVIDRAVPQEKATLAPEACSIHPLERMHLLRHAYRKIGFSGHLSDVVVDNDSVEVRDRGNQEIIDQDTVDMHLVVVVAQLLAGLPGY